MRSSARLAVIALLLEGIFYVLDMFSLGYFVGTTIGPYEITFFFYSFIVAPVFVWNSSFLHIPYSCLTIT
jgi:hypothetical protein